MKLTCTFKKCLYRNETLICLFPLSLLHGFTFEDEWEYFLPIEMNRNVFLLVVGLNHGFLALQASQSNQ